MGHLLAIGGGAVCGIAAAAPLFLQLRGGRAGVGRGLGAVVASFLAVQLAMLAVHALWPSELAFFGVPAALALLVVTVAGAL